MKQILFEASVVISKRRQANPWALFLFSTPPKKKHKFYIAFFVMDFSDHAHLFSMKGSFLRSISAMTIFLEQSF